MPANHLCNVITSTVCTVIMPYCQGWNCNNKPEDHAGKSFFQFPKPEDEREHLERWLHNCGTGLTIKTFSWNRNKKICSDHFHPNCFEENLMSKLLGCKSKGKLKPGAVPTIFSHKTYETINMNGEMMPPKLSVASAKRTKIMEHEEVMKKAMRTETRESQSTSDFAGSSSDTPRSSFELFSVDVDHSVPSTYHTSSPRQNKQQSAASHHQTTLQIMDQLDISNVADQSAIDNDSEYVPANETDYSERSDIFDMQNNEEPGPSTFNIQKEKKYVITESQLDMLLRRISCQSCGSTVSSTKFKKKILGTCVTVTGVCSECEEIMLDWSSQPFIGKLPAYNLLAAASIFFSGSTYHTFEKSSQFSGLQFINNNTFYQIQRNLIIPAINKLYNQKIAEARAEIKTENCRVKGDGRYDSRGKCAKYCTYSFQSVESNKIIASTTLQTENGKGSAPLEMKGFINCLSDLVANNIHAFFL